MSDDPLRPFDPLTSSTSTSEPGPSKLSASATAFVPPSRLDADAAPVVPRWASDQDEVAEEEDAEEEDDFQYPATVDRSAPMPITSLSRPPTTTPPSKPLGGLSVTPTAAWPTPKQPSSSDSDVEEEPDVVVANPASSLSPSEQAIAVCDACATGSLEDLKAILHANDQAFTLANTQHPRSGLMPLHLAASRGSVPHVLYLVDEVGALLDCEDPSGETALQKAAHRGHLSIIRLLLGKGGAELVQSADADGWVALHNAASKGYLDIVRLLVEMGAAIDQQSKLGYTPLMCAASRGHAVVVRYLLGRPLIDVFLRNSHGETAYDVAVASFEIYIADLLQAVEATTWSEAHADDHSEAYNPLALHLNVALILHENQRAVTGSRALLAARPRFSSSSLLRSDRRTPFTLPPSGLSASKEHLALFRSDVNLPTVDEPFTLPLPRRPTTPRIASSSSGRSLPPPSPSISSSPSSPERAWFYLSEWFVELTSPAVDPTEGWTYAPSFDAKPDKWSPTAPTEFTSHKAVRHRRWVRVLRRRLDRPPLPFADLDVDAELCDLSSSSAVGGDVEEVQERGGRNEDYVARARWMAVGIEQDADALSVRSGMSGRAHARRMLGRLESAVSELRNGLATDDDETRRLEAEKLLETYSRRLSDVRSELGSLNVEAEDEEPRPIPRRTSSVVSGYSANGDYFQSSTRSVSANRAPDLTPQLILAPDFRTPSHEAPAPFGPAPSLPPPTRAAAWQPDDAATACARCSKRFSLFLRKHHCRLCGQVVCANCSSHNDVINPDRLVPDPHVVLFAASPADSKHRTCDSCHAELTASLSPSPRAPTPASPMTGSVASEISELSECVVCGTTLTTLGDKVEQEKHVQSCLERGSGTTAASHRFVAFRLPAASPLVGKECEICLEDLVPGAAVAVLTCLCSLHEPCARAWLVRGKGCPVHARDV